MVPELVAMVATMYQSVGSPHTQTTEVEPTQAAPIRLHRRSDSQYTSSTWAISNNTRPP